MYKVTMDATELLDRYLLEMHMMQLATSDDGRPWNCTLYYVHDDERNLYWASLPSRRHSLEITDNPKVAVSIPARFVNGEKVVGIQIEGTAEVLEASEEIREISAKYAAKFKRDSAWIEDFVSGNTEHRLYKLTPDKIYLFDEQNFPEAGRQQIPV